MPTGRVKWYDTEKGFGFLTQDDGGDVYVHSDALPSDVTTLKAGARVEFGIAQGRRGDQALQLRVLEPAPSVERSQARSGGGRGERGRGGRGPSAGPRKTPEEMTVIVEDLIKVLDDLGEGYRHGRRPDARSTRPVAQLLRALATELD